MQRCRHRAPPLPCCTFSLFPSGDGDAARRPGDFARLLFIFLDRVPVLAGLQAAPKQSKNQLFHSANVCSYPAALGLGRETRQDWAVLLIREEEAWPRNNGAAARPRAGWWQCQRVRVAGLRPARPSSMSGRGHGPVEEITLNLAAVGGADTGARPHAPRCNTDPGGERAGFAHSLCHPVAQRE